MNLKKDRKITKGMRLVFVLCMNLWVLMATLCQPSNQELFLIHTVKKLSPNLDLKEVKQIFNQNDSIQVMFESESDVKDPYMDRRWTQEKAYWKYGVTEDLSFAGCVVFFDSTLKIIGFTFSAPNGPQLKSDELLFK